MQKIFILFIFLLFIQHGNSQINPFGLSLTSDGKIELVTGEPNYNGHVDDPICVKCGENSYIADLRNVNYEFLTILEAPDQKWISPSNMDPSRRYDTTYIKQDVGPFDFTGNIFEPMFVVYVDSSIQPIENVDQARKFDDEMEGLNLNDSIVSLVKCKLEHQIRTYSRKYLQSEISHEFYKELSCIDSVAEKQYVFDYLVDRLLFYNYDGNQLAGIMGYHWDSGVEFDSLRYDDSGNLVYFSREHLGAICNEYHFEYQENRVVKITHNYITAANSEEDFDVQDKDIAIFGYNSSGKVISRSNLQSDGNWSVCYFGID